ncbi:MAG TPA: archaetidylserine decarboxylase [Bacillota bacterium]|nr:archaetidylserine decarboxylase [Bacillota bacterium]
MIQDKIMLAMLNLIPRNSLSRLAGRITGSGLSRRLIPLFVQRYDIRHEEAEKAVGEYDSLRDFFIRRLRAGLRPVDMDEQAVVSPVDGLVAVAGTIDQGMLLQAKGIYYSLRDLLGGDELQAKRFTGGTFITIYLSPRDYHRIHMPTGGRLQGYTYVPGTLFPVNPFGVRAIKGLFAKNERLITYFATKIGLVAMVKVGATIVGSVKVTYSDVSTNARGGRLSREQFHQGPELGKGEELGWFEFGSTVILLFEKDRLVLDGSIGPGTRLKMGERLGTCRQES